MTDTLDPISFVRQARRLVVKVGTSVLTDQQRGCVARNRVESIASEVAALWKKGRKTVLVSSGAIGAGMGVLKLKGRPHLMGKLQAAAAIGQVLLMQWYTQRLEQEGFHAAQILLTRDDLEDRKRYTKAKATLETLLEANVVPIINENDTVSVEEIRFGDNDLLSAHVAALVGADLLVMLSDVDQILGPVDPLRIYRRITPQLLSAARGTSNVASTGGMRTKLEAAKMAMASGIPMVLLNGRGSNHLLEMVLEGENRGTWFISEKNSKLSGKQRWLALTGRRSEGVVQVDSGAKEALIHRGRSLLASGIHEVEGKFQPGDLVSVREAGGEEFARGLVNYSSEELKRIARSHSRDIPALLGTGRKGTEVIHRDSLVVLEK